MLDQIGWWTFVTETHTLIIAFQTSGSDSRAQSTRPAACCTRLQAVLRDSAFRTRTPKFAIRYS